MKPLWTLTSNYLGISAKEKKRGVLKSRVLRQKRILNPSLLPEAGLTHSLAPTQQQPDSLAQAARA